MAGEQMQSLSRAQRTVLDAFLRALQRESHVLIEHPDLLWQQLHNHLQWGDDKTAALVGAERKQRCLPGAAIWVRARTPFRQSEALLRTLTGHTVPVTRWRSPGRGLDRLRQQ